VSTARSSFGGRTLTHSDRNVVKIRLGPYFYNAIAAGRQAISVLLRVLCVRTSLCHDRISHGILMFMRRERAPHLEKRTPNVCVFIVYAFICL